MTLHSHNSHNATTIYIRIDRISYFLRAMGRGEEARTAAQEAQALRSCPPPAGCPQAGSGPDGRRRRADSLRSTGITMRAAGRYEEARAASLQALSLYDGLSGTEEEQADCLYRTGDVLRSVGRCEEARAAWRISCFGIISYYSVIIRI